MNHPAVNNSPLASNLSSKEAKQKQPPQCGYCVATIVAGLANDVEMAAVSRRKACPTAQPRPGMSAEAGVRD